jgi:hypothetical protein
MKKNCRNATQSFFPFTLGQFKTYNTTVPMLAIVSAVHLNGTQNTVSTDLNRKKGKILDIFFIFTLEQLKTKNTTAHMPAIVSSLHLKGTQKCKCQLTLMGER